MFNFPLLIQQVFFSLIGSHLHARFLFTALVLSCLSVLLLPPRLPSYPVGHPVPSRAFYGGFGSAASTLLPSLAFRLPAAGSSPPLNDHFCAPICSSTLLLPPLRSFAFCKPGTLSHMAQALLLVLPIVQ